MEKNNFLAEKIFQKSWVPFLIIAFLGFFLYFQTIFFDFSYLDDNNLIIDNQHFLSNLSNIFNSFLTDVFHLSHSAFYYRPFLTISLIFDYQIGGVSPAMYHFTNLILHIISACLLFIFLNKLNYKKIFSFLFSIIFLVHPVLTQAVAWIPGRNDSLLAIFVLATLIFFIKYLNEQKKNYLFGSLFFFAIAIFTKESALLVLPIAFFYLYFFYRKENKLSFNKFYFFLYSIGILILWFFLRNIALSGSIGINFENILKSVSLNSPAIIQFLGKIFFPFNLSVMPIIQDTTFVYGFLALIILIILIYLTKEKRWNFILFGVGWFLMFLLPSFIRPNPDIIADFIEHRIYLPIIGIIIILLETDFIKKINFERKRNLFLFGILILFFCVLTIIHSSNFTNRLTFWENAVQNSPHYPLAHRNLGAMKYLDGDLEIAEQEFKKSLELNPKEEMAHNNLGLIYVQKNMFSEAEEEYKKEIEINPYYDNVYFNLGLLYYQQKKYDQAVDNWKKTLALNPNFIDTLGALMIYNYEQKNYKEMEFYAIELSKRGIQILNEIIRILRTQ